VLTALSHASQSGQLSRVCLQVTDGSRALEETERLLADLRGATPLPTCATLLPRSQSDVERVFAAGADVVGFGLDAVTPELYEVTKAIGSGADVGLVPSWHGQMDLIECAARRHPGQVGVHLIVGLGETERQTVELVQRLTDVAARVALFAFTPVRGTDMESARPPQLAAYRRIQVARFLISAAAARVERFTFDFGGRIRGFGISAEIITRLLRSGDAFRTSGCSGCNRPYYNERPGAVPYNYPRALTAMEAVAAILTLELD
jgi:lipoyl synthase